jgi:hypothetical protein
MLRYRIPTSSWSTPWWWHWTTQKPIDTAATTASQNHNHHHGNHGNHGNGTPADDYEHSATAPTSDSNQGTTSTTWWPWWWHRTTKKPIDTTTTASDHHDHHHGNHGNETTTDDYKRTTTTPTSDWNRGTAPTTWRPWSTSHSPLMSTTRTEEWLLESCPRLPRGNRSRVDVPDVISRPYWYELIRVQTSNSPAYVEQIACSTMRLNATSPNDAEVLLMWEEGSSYHRKSKNVTRM